MIWRETAGSGTGLSFWESGGGLAVFHRNQAMIAHNWMAGALFQACCQLPARPTTTSAAPAAPMPPLAAPPPCCTTDALRQPAAPAVWCNNTTKTATARGRNLIHLWGSERGAWRPLKSSPGWQGDFLQTCEFGEFGAATLRPMAARPCSPAPALGNVLVMPIWGRHTQRRG